MKVPLRWLEEFVSLDVSVEKLVELLDLSGTKVEAVTKPSGAIAGVVVAQVLEIVPHPDADNLTLVDVTTGDGEPQRVVCGARNFAAGQRVPLAQVGARLPQMEIGERKIRGEVSRGMLCSSAELGLSSDHSGILVLPDDSGLGVDIVSLLGLDDTILDLEITPNRPDCMSILGVAREVSALLSNELKRAPIELETDPELSSPVRVEITAPDGCPRYLARYVEGVEVRPSPAWMTARLLSVGVRPISNVVDVTNYVLFELGHPLHAFDAATLPDQQIVVRRAKTRERITTLDGHERLLHPDDLLISGKKKPLAIAGVMGGSDSEVGPHTRNVIIESAYFHPTSIAFTSRRHGLRTEASARFERGADPEIVDTAAARAAALMQRFAGGRVAAEITDVYPAPTPRNEITLRTARAGQVLGTSLASERQAAYLRALEMGVTQADGVLQVEVPSFRHDLRREIDLIEEVGRLAGFDSLPATLPPGRTGRLERDQAIERSLRRLLADLGLFEAWTGSFMSEADLERLGVTADQPAAKMVRLANPMSEDEPAMRTSLLPGLLRAVALNERQRARGVALFELARVYEPTVEQLPHEALIVAGVMSGPRRRGTWIGSERAWDFFDGKGLVQVVFSALGLPEPSFSPVQGRPFHPTRAAAVAHLDVTVGAVGELHPKVLAGWDIERASIAFELALGPLLAALPAKKKVEELPRFPSNLIDVAIVVERDVPARAAERVIRDAGAPELAEVDLFDVYEGDQVGPGKKSLAFALELRAVERSLPDAEATAVRDRIVAALTEQLGAELRG